MSSRTPFEEGRPSWSIVATGLLLLTRARRLLDKPASSGTSTAPIPERVLESGVLIARERQE